MTTAELDPPCNNTLYGGGAVILSRNLEGLLRGATAATDNSGGKRVEACWKL